MPDADTFSVQRLNPVTLSEADARSAAGLNQLVWPKDDFSLETATAKLLSRRETDFTDPRNAWFVVRDTADSARIIAKAETFARRVVPAEGDPLVILALAGVCVHPDLRGRGLGKAVVQAAFTRVDAGEFLFCLFQTAAHNERFYAPMGCVVVENRFVNGTADDPDARPWWDDLVMIYPGVRAGEWPGGLIDLCGEAY